MIGQKFDVDQAHNVVVLTFAARQLSAPLTQEACDEILSRLRYDNARYFILDLSGVEFISSDCLGLLVLSLQEVEHVRGRIVLANCRPNVAFLFKVTRLDSVFALYDDLDAARAGLAGS